VPYLPGFWTAIGPYLPPRNAFILMRNSVYFGGNGTAQALTILLGYLVVFGAILGILDWYRRPPRRSPTSHTRQKSRPQPCRSPRASRYDTLGAGRGPRERLTRS
jgi:hypothetical protein